ncbi:Pectin acetylesterase [Heracleum sosnowskyi]|uniref:Pectin acetylesterase n=1 Tax=Heracleum sosnowskyi TaxID=360622 RepID=A0AAD8MS25_9APIA|nr:Pectin acetylesterase [Heracleum sosnowskyi]
MVGLLSRGAEGMAATRLYQGIYTLLVVCNLIILGRGVDLPYVTRLVKLTYLHSAVRQGAVCLDGSPPAYQFDKGFGDGVNNWLIFLEGGGWCDTTQDCLNRILLNGMGSSTNMFPKNFTGMTSNEQSLNPYFYNWNRVYVRYCDGSSFTGNSVDPEHKLHYKGAKIFNVVVKDLLAKGMKNASNALLSGCSAGGLAALLNCDRFRSLLSTSTRVKCASDAGYFPHLKDVLGGFSFAKYFDKIVNLHGSAKNLPKSCTSKMKPRSLCFHPQYSLPYVETPFFIINSAYDTYQIANILAPNITNLPKSWETCRSNTTTCLMPDHVETLKEFRLGFLDALPKLGNSSFRGMFISSCLIHCQYHLQQSWNGDDPRFRLHNKAISEALGEWYYDKAALQRIDHENDLPRVCLTL